MLKLALKSGEKTSNHAKFVLLVKAGIEAEVGDCSKEIAQCFPWSLFRFSLNALSHILLTEFRHLIGSVF